MLKTAQRLWSCSSRLKVNDEIPLVVYHSLRSKLRVVIADVPGPTVKGILSFGWCFFFLFIYLFNYLLICLFTYLFVYSLIYLLVYYAFIYLIN